MQYQQAPIPAAAAAPASTPFQLEEALFSSAPVGLHCINSSGIILWANKMELTLLGFTREQYVGQQVESLVYMDLEKGDSNSYLANAAISNQLQLQQQQQQQQQLGSNSNTAATSNNQQQQQAVNFVNDRTLYKEVLKQITSGHAVHDIPIRFVTYSGNVLHLILDCDAVPVVLHHTRSANNSLVVTEEIYYRCFTRDDTARRIQEMRSNVLFQETNRSLQMLDNFMNRSMVRVFCLMMMIS
jgi:transcriptional regulator with PAS, ATPase and Fis domain